MRWHLAVLVTLGSCAVLALAGCERSSTPQGTAAGGTGVKSIKVVIADYSKDHTKPFWQALSEKTRDDFLPSFAQGGEFRGKLYGFPILASARAFFYNKTLFAKAGIAEPPRTWDDFVKTAQKIRGLGGGTIGYALPLGPEEAQAEWEIWMWNGGGDWKSGDQWAINSEANVKTLT